MAYANVHNMNGESIPCITKSIYKMPTTNYPYSKIKEGRE